MLRCVRCGTENPERSQFCDECGRRLSHLGDTVAGSWRNTRLTMTEDEADGDLMNETEATADAPPSSPAAAMPTDSLIGWRGAATAAAATAAGGAENDDDNLTQKTHQAVTGTITAPAFAYARLIIERGKNAGKEFILSENEINIGRWDADNGVFPDVDLDADDPEAKVSRRHARIVRYGNQYLVEDLGSTNGTFINRGRRLLPGNRQIIEDGDEIIVGKTFLRFQVIR